jgi:serine/threonine protein kinase
MTRKLYGGRWKTVPGVPPLGEGGQSVVFPVVDVRGEYQGHWALKRVLNPARHERFRNEIEAIKRLRHPSIIKLIDHSALDDDAEKQFLVMPIADGGDLSKRGRIELYRETLDGALLVAKQIANGLRAAHANNVLHRDIKPQNILFTGRGHDIWISDFGICLLRGQDRTTPTPEVVGPRAFMAPELEDGGKLEVTPAADIYSLGKVIYYMVSGGIMLPRERLHEEQHSRIFDRGERYRLLHHLLMRMVSPLSSRLQTMEDVIRDLENIQAWERNAQLLPISETGRAAIAQMQRRTLDAYRIRSENLTAQEHEQRTFASVKDGFTDWLRAKLDKVAAFIGNGIGLRVEVREPAIPDPQNTLTVETADHAAYVSVSGIELTLADASHTVHRCHRLLLLLCREQTLLSIFGYASLRPPEPVGPIRLAFLPVYRQTLEHQHPQMSAMMGYLTASSQVGNVAAKQIQTPKPDFELFGLGKITHSFLPGISQCFPFVTSEWPSCTDRLRKALSEAIDTFIGLASSGEP